MNLNDLKILSKVYRFACEKKVTLYLVGGYLRDIFLERQKHNPDIDFAIAQGSIKFGRALANHLQAGFVVLDKERGSCRLVKESGGIVYTLDLTDFRADSIEKDLILRDFTVNTLCAELSVFLKSTSVRKAVMDVCGARVDMKKKSIRQVNKKTFDDDPLRILRAFSMAAIFGFSIDRETIKSIVLKKAKLKDVSLERIRDEFFKIFESDYAYKYLKLMDSLGVLGVVFPEIEMMRGVKQGPYHHLDVLEHSFESVKQLERLFVTLKKDAELQKLLQQELSGQRRRFGLMKLGVFLHDIGKPKALKQKEGKLIFHGHERVGAYFAKGIGKRLKLSNDELEVLNKLVFWHLRPGYLADTELPTERAKFRFFRDCSSEAISVLLVSLADQRSTRGPLTTKKSREQHERVCASLIKEYFRKLKEEKLPRLLNGDDVMKEFSLKPSPFVGDILRQIEELQAIGILKTKVQALEKIRKIIVVQAKLKKNRKSHDQESENDISGV